MPFTEFGVRQSFMSLISAPGGAPVPVSEASLILPEKRVGCIILRYERQPRLAHPRLVIRTTSTPISDEAVDALISFSSTVLGRGETYSCLWDLSSVCTPRAGPIWRCIGWAAKNKRALDANLVAVAIVMGGGGIRKVVEFVLWVTRPPMPQRCFDDADAALEFAASVDPVTPVDLPARCGNPAKTTNAS
jgi:hypothetical protein